MARVVPNGEDATKDAKDQELNIEQLRATFTNINNPRAQALLKNIIRFASSLQGTQPF